MTDQILDQLARRIADPGAFTRRQWVDRDDAHGRDYETVAQWGARAIAADLTDGTLGYVPAAQAEADITRLKQHLVDEQARLRGHLDRANTGRQELQQELSDLEHRIRLLLITPDGDRNPDETATVAQISAALHGTTEAAPAVHADPEPAQAATWLIWSHHHQAWWGPNGAGYRQYLADAGRYTLTVAQTKMHRGCRCCQVPEVPVDLPNPALAGYLRTRVLRQRIAEATDATVQAGWANPHWEQAEPPARPIEIVQLPVEDQGETPEDASPVAYHLTRGSAPGHTSLRTARAASRD